MLVWWQKTKRVFTLMSLVCLKTVWTKTARRVELVCPCGVKASPHVSKNIRTFPKSTTWSFHHVHGVREFLAADGKLTDPEIFGTFTGNSKLELWVWDSSVQFFISNKFLCTFPGCAVKKLKGKTGNSGTKYSRTKVFG